MNKITKDNRGITLVALIITIILMLILVSVTTYSGINSYKNAQVTKFVTQMQLLQAKVDDLVSSKTIEELNSMNLQTPTTQEQQNTINSAANNEEVTTNNVNEYKVFTKEDVLNILDVEDVQNDIMVNFTTREIVSLVGIEYEGKTYYTQYKLPNGQAVINNESVSRDLSFTPTISIDGLNATITISDIKITNGTLSYKEQSDNYAQTITNYTEKGKEYKINISKSGKYVFILRDNTSDKTSEVQEVITLTNKPKTNSNLDQYNYGKDSTEWAYMQRDGVNYVWIPRFAYKTNTDTNSTEIKFIKGNSNIATDNSYINDEWETPKDFTLNDGTKLTGIWIKVDSENQENLDMINLINDTSKTILTTI